MKNEDYLWDKSGSDAEIEHLENALKVFRGRDIEAPAIVPAAELAPYARSEKNSRSIFSFGIVSFACFALAVFGLGIFHYFGNGNENAVNINPVYVGKAESQITKTKVIEPTVEDEALNTEIRQELPVILPTSYSKNSAAKRNLSPPRKIQRAKVKRPKVQILELTEEEKYAYDQLMLALSITSSNLKVVKDKVEGSE